MPANGQRRNPNVLLAQCLADPLEKTNQEERKQMSKEHKELAKDMGLWVVRKRGRRP